MKCTLELIRNAFTLEKSISIFASLAMGIWSTNSSNQNVWVKYKAQWACVESIPPTAAPTLAPGSQTLAPGSQTITPSSKDQSLLSGQNVIYVSCGIGAAVFAGLVA